MRVTRWLALDPEADEKLQKEAEKECRSIAGMLKYIITKYLK